MDQLLLLFEKYPGLAVLISLVASIIVALVGLLPSVFITTANILFFGFWPGTFLSFAGEVAGSFFAFYLYRRGFKKIAYEKLHHFKQVAPLVDATGAKAFYLVFILRLLPFIPSGIVTFVAAIGKVSGLTFMIASSLGKIPSLLLEAYSVNQVLKLSWQGKVIMSLVLIMMLIIVFKRLTKRSIRGKA